MGKIIVSHIGARNGYYPFPFNKNFKDEVTAYLYEADKNCIDEIKQINKNRYETIVINKFIGSKNGQIDFHINSCPHNSSSLETNFENNFCLYHGFDDDMTLEGAFQNIKSIKLNTFTLSSLLSSNEVPPIDSLSLDTLGN